MHNARIKGLGNQEELATQYLLALHQIGYFKNAVEKMKMDAVSFLVGGDTESKEFKEQMAYYKFNIQLYEAINIECETEQRTRDLRLTDNRS